MAKEKMTKISLNVSVSLNEQIEEQCRDFMGSTIEIPKSTYIRMAIEERVKKDKKLKDL